MTKKTPLIAEVDIEIPFHDVDAADIVWHGHYVKYIEIARCKLLDLIEYNYPQMKASGYLWPVIDIRIQYVRPAVFQQVIRVVATLIEWEHRLKIKYQILDVESGQRLTKGYSVQVAVEAETGEMLLASPDVLQKKFGVEGL
ncbi:MAG: acyl-CoA thioesterase [Porticoccus sp.]|nr:acyl-CoA thioesterase [Porticoccus sp.]MBQ0807569.1 acyl-CoA thioesterase [Porticoccus sp.]